MIVTKVLLPAGLAFIMFAMGLTLKVGDFTRLLKRPLPVVLGLSVQMLLLPVLAWLLLMVFRLPPAYAVGIMILAACPGGITSNMITHIARGDTALSITLTAITSLAGMLTIPFIVALALAHFAGEQVAGLPAPRMALGVFLVSTLPVVVGMTIHHLAPNAAARIERVARPLSLVIFALIVFAAFASQWRVMMANMHIIGPVVIALNVLIMVLGWNLGAAFGMPQDQKTAIAIEGGLQNGALGIFVATTLLNNPQMMTPSITYALIMNFTAFAFIAWRLYAARAVRSGAA
jgi:BASS family bile acid:Na+ symporter